MAKIGIRKIKIAKKSEVPDTYFDRSGLIDHPEVNFLNIDFVQNSASLSDVIEDDENGTYHNINLTFSVRLKHKVWLNKLQSYINKPVVIMIDAVDGCSYIIGGLDSIVQLKSQNKYSRFDVKELIITCDYQNINGLIDR